MNRKDFGRAFGACLRLPHLRLRRLAGHARIGSGRACGASATAGSLCLTQRFAVRVRVAGSVVELAGRAQLAGPREDRLGRLWVAGLGDD
jgi:hypothetical protein